MNEQPQRRWSSDIPTVELPSTTARKEKRLNCLLWALMASAAVILVVGIAAIAYILLWWR